AVKAVSDEGVPGTSGKVNPAFDVRIVGPRGQPLPAGEVGEIACRARSPHVMSEGYVSAAGGKLRVEPHSPWFRTGDLGMLDADQNLTYVDRVKDSLRRRGENVSSVEVEAAVMRHPAVLEAAAVGVPSELGEDDILVVLTLRPGAALDHTELLDFCSERMPYFCVPRYLEVLDELPKNVIGRVRKDVLRGRGLGADAWDREAHGYVLGPRIPSEEGERT
ncbi:MAG: AMP-binding protein, partial [Mycolicibacterium sp.]|nr:AMP-binding protein [Mycolicibacterium sp.]